MCDAVDKDINGVSQAQNRLDATGGGGGVQNGTCEHRVLERLLGHHADQPVQQGGHGRAQVPEEARLPHQAELLSAFSQAAPRGLE